MSRPERVASKLRQTICRIIQEDVKDHRFGFVTITDVRLSADLRTANIYFTVMGNAKQVKASQEAIEGANAFIRRELAKQMHMRYVPVLNFRLDTSQEYGAKIDSILEKIRREKKPADDRLY